MKRFFLCVSMSLVLANTCFAEETRRLLLPLPHATEVQAMAFSTGRTRLATGDKSGLVKIWNWNRKSVEMSLQPRRGDEAQIEWLQWISDTLLVVQRSDSQYRVYDVLTGDEVSVLTLKSSSKPALLPEKRLAVVVTQGEWGDKSQVPVVQVYNLESGKLERTLQVPGIQPNSHWVKGIAASPDGQKLMLSVDPIGAGDEWLVEIDSQSGSQIRSQTIVGGYAPEHLRYSPSGKYVAGRSWDMVIWGDDGVKVVKPDRAGLMGLDWASENEIVYTISNDGATLHRMKLPDLKPEAPKKVEGGWASAPVLVSPEGIPTFTSREGNLFNGDTGADLVKAPAVNHVNCVAFHPSGRLVTGLNEGDVLVWDMTTGKQGRRFQVPGNIRGVAISQDGQRLAVTTNHDNDVRVFDWKSGKLVASVKTDCVQGSGYVVKFSPDGQNLAVVQSKPPGWVDELLLLNIRTGEPIWKKEKTYRFAFHPSQNKWAVLRKEGLAEIDLNTGDESLHRIKNLKDCAYDAQGNLYALQSLGSSWGSKLLKMYPKVTGRLDEGAVIREWNATSLDRLVYSERDGSWWVRCVSGALYQVDKSGGDKQSLPDGVATGGWGILPDGLVACPGREGSLEFWRGSQATPEGQLVILKNGSNWLVTSSGGFFDGTNEAEQLLEWQVGKNRYRVDQFFKQGYRPGLLREFYRGAKLSKTPGPLAQVLVPPKMEILSPLPGARVEGRETEVRVKIVDQGHGYSAPKVFVNGHPVAASNTRSTSPTEYIFKTRLQPGLNEIRATGFDGTGQVESRGDRMRLTCVAEARRKPVLYVVAVGVNHASSGRPLQFAEKDAQSFAQSLKLSPANQVEVKVLCGKQATKTELDGVFRQIESTAEPQDTVVTFFAGHGVAENSGYRFLLSGKDVERDSLTSAELAGYLESIPAHRQFVVLDTCHSAAASPDLASRFAVSQQRLARGSGTFLLAACRSGETAAEVKSLQHGLLTYSLLNGFSKEGAHPNSQGQITVNSLIQFVSTDFPEVSRRHEQNQELYQFTQGSDFPLARPKN